MSVWPKLPLTDSCLSPLPGFESRPGHVKRCNDLVLGSFFCRALCFKFGLKFRSLSPFYRRTFNLDTCKLQTMPWVYK